jgi:protein-S-isoprenylcysteine O-methyltransferase Ste14
VFLLWVAWALTYWRGGAGVAHAIRQTARSGNARFDKAIMVIVPALTLVLLGTGALLVGAPLVGAPAWLRPTALLDGAGPVAAGALLTAAAIAGTFYCRHYLGRFWAAETQLLAEHHVVDRGPYGVVRHPIFTAAITLYAGTALTYATWWSLVAGAICIACYLVKATYEDAFLAENLDGYRAYRERVRRRLVPFVW